MTPGLEQVPLGELLPHRPPMVLLDGVVAHRPERTTCRTTVREAPGFHCPDGRVPGWIALEYMAQCIAVHAGLRARAAGGTPRLGFLVGSRRVDFHAAAFARGQGLLVTAEHVWGDAELGSFSCRVEDAAGGEVLADGVLKVVAADAALGARDRSPA
jgi:predicted hotdog family 3-hydroxylacyl-ACP dehydratase